MATVSEIRKARLMLGWSVEQLAKRAKVSTADIVSGESGALRWRPLVKHRLLIALEHGGITFPLHEPNKPMSRAETNRKRRAAARKAVWRPRQGKQQP